MVQLPSIKKQGNHKQKIANSSMIYKKKNKKLIVLSYIFRKYFLLVMFFSCSTKKPDVLSDKYIDIAILNNIFEKVNCVDKSNLVKEGIRFSFSYKDSSISELNFKNCDVSLINEEINLLNNLERIEICFSTKPIKTINFNKLLKLSDLSIKNSSFLEMPHISETNLEFLEIFNNNCIVEELNLDLLPKTIREISFEYVKFNKVSSLRKSQFDKLESIDLFGCTFDTLDLSQFNFPNIKSIDISQTQYNVFIGENRIRKGIVKKDSKTSQQGDNLYCL